jgi:hypothetical protein
MASKKIVPMTKDEFSKLKKYSDMFETITCSRCRGCGEYSFCPQWGTMCFKCSGSGKVYSKRGFRSYNAYKTLQEKSVTEIKVGDSVYINRVGGGGRWVYVDTIESTGVCQHTIDGVYSESPRVLINGNHDEEGRLRVLPDADTRYNHYVAALAA